MISLHTRKYHLTDLPFLKVIGENTIEADVLIKLSISPGITGIQGLASCGIWLLGAEVCGGLGAPGDRHRPRAQVSQEHRPTAAQELCKVSRPGSPSHLRPLIRLRAIGCSLRCAEARVISLKTPPTYLFVTVDMHYCISFRCTAKSSTI